MTLKTPFELLHKLGPLDTIFKGSFNFKIKISPRKTSKQTAEMKLQQHVYQRGSWAQR